jgi:hypothetical protein
MLIFVIDHEKSRLTQLVQQISEAARAARDAKILEYASAVTAGDAISKWGIPDAVFLDADGWEREGCGFVRSVKEKDPQCRIILISDSDVYAMKAYAACVVLESRGRLSERDELLKKIVARDSFWIGYGYIAAFNDHLKLLGSGPEK